MKIENTSSQIWKFQDITQAESQISMEKNELMKAVQLYRKMCKETISHSAHQNKF